MLLIVVFPPWYQTNAGSFAGWGHRYLRGSHLVAGRRHSTRIVFFWELYVVEFLGSAGLVYWGYKWIDRWKRYGECDECGYDLRGTVAARRRLCPECGAEVEVGEETTIRLDRS